MDKSKEQMMELQRLMQHLQSGGLLGDLSLDQTIGQPSQFASEDVEEIKTPRTYRRDQGRDEPSAANRQLTSAERWNPNSAPDGNPDDWYWLSQHGWSAKAKDGNIGKSSFFNNDGERVYYDNVTDNQDQRLKDLRREMITGRGAWRDGADQLIKEGMLYNRQTDPYVRTDEDKAQQLADYQNSLAEYNTAVARGDVGSEWLVKPQMPVFTSEQDELAYTGRGQFKPGVLESMEFSPFTDVYNRDIDGVVRNLKSDWYNPFYDLNDNPLYIQRMRELGNDQFGSTYDARSEDNAMDWLYQKTLSSGADRKLALDTFDNYVKDSAFGRRDLYNRKMDRRLYSAMGMDKVFGEYDGTGGGFADLNINPLTGDSSGGTNPITGGPDMSSGDGFLKSFIDKKDEIANRPTVMSLFDEMKEYE